VTSANKTAFHAAIIFGVGLLLITPAMLSQPMTHDSFWIDRVWADQFTSELSRGSLYPRWLPRSHGGLGSPVLYYYPPLAFYLTGLFGLVGLQTYASIIGTFLTGFVASGLAMYAWLKGNSRAPLFGSLLFMAAPYHVLDFYSRGAIAEFIAIAFIPLVALGLRRASEGRLILCTIAYAGLILTHLPVALLVSLFLVAPYSLCLCRHEPRHLTRIALPLSLGLAISAVYLLPAIALAPYRDGALLWRVQGFRPEDWSLLRWGQTAPPPEAKLFMTIIILSLLQPTVVLLFGSQRRWSLWAGFCLLMAAALVPVIWQAPLLRSVQFPFRMLPLAEFALATGIAHVTLPRVIVYAATLPMFALSTISSVGQHGRTGPPMPKYLMAQYVDVPENLPPGNRPFSWPSYWALTVARSHTVPLQLGGQTVEPVFYFPAWQVWCQGQRALTAPEATTKLLTYKGMGCKRRLGRTIPERIGTAISLTALLVLLSLVAFRSRRSLVTHVDHPDVIRIDTSPAR
jgi:hypothetical protein